MELVYEKPAGRWIDGLPIGNGRLAAMVQETEQYDEISVNHEWLWGRGDKNRRAKDNAEFLPMVRSLFEKDRYYEGAYLTNFFFSGHNGLDEEAPKLQIPSMAGEVVFRYLCKENRYIRRSLNIRTGVATIQRQIDGNTVACQCFASCVDQQIYLSWQSATPFSGLLQLSRTPLWDHKSDERHADPYCRLEPLGVTEAELVLQGILLDERKQPSIAFCNRLSYHTDGKLQLLADGVEIQNATYLYAVLNVGTSAQNDNLQIESCHAVLPGDWQESLKKHCDRFSELMDRVDFSLNESSPEQENKDISARVADLKAGQPDNGLCKLYFDFGRYLMVSATVCAELPTHLQGKWNTMIDPPWASDYHANINLQMNYWATEAINMPEAAEGLIAFLNRQIPAGQDNAMRNYGCRGILFPQSFDVSAAYYGVFGWSAWIGAAAWLAQHVWWHYTYSGDQEYLRKEGYEYLKQVAMFYEDYLQPDRQGVYHISPSHSPENRVMSQPGLPVAICTDCAMDIQLAYDGLTYAIEAASTLGVDAELAEKWQHIRSHLPQCRIGSDGRLMEWDREFEESDPGHRHLSHLYGLYPGELFTPNKNLELYRAAICALEDRMAKGSGPSGWSRAWCACLFARLRRKEEFYEHYTMLIREFAAETLLDLHPPHIFQIDGNFGGVAAVIETIVGYFDNRVHILPALPEQWHTGHLNGIKVPGGHRINVAWKCGVLTELSVLMGYQNDLTLCYGDKYYTVSGNPGEMISIV